MIATIVAAIIGAAATIIAAYIVAEKTQRRPLKGENDLNETFSHRPFRETAAPEYTRASAVSGAPDRGGQKPGGDAAPVSESEGERLFRTRNGPFLNAIEGAGGAVPMNEFHALGRKFGFDTRGLGGFFVPSGPSIRREGDMNLLTERGRDLAKRWRDLYGNEDPKQ